MATLAACSSTQTPEVRARFRSATRAINRLHDPSARTTSPSSYRSPNLVPPPPVGARLRLQPRRPVDGQRQLARDELGYPNGESRVEHGLYVASTRESIRGVAAFCGHLR